MPCILKAVIGWLILLVVSGAVGLFLRQALFGLFVPFPSESSNQAIAAALRDTHRSFKRRHIANTIFNLIVSAGYLWAVFHFFGLLMAATAFLVMLVAIEHYSHGPLWLHHLATLALWASVIPVWYALCKT